MDRSSLNSCDVGFLPYIWNFALREEGIQRSQGGADITSFNSFRHIDAHVLLYSLNKLGKRDKMRGLPSILSLFLNDFNKFKNTRARMLDSIFHMTNTLKSHFCVKMLYFCHCVRNVVMDVITFPEKR